MGKATHDMIKDAYSAAMGRSGGFGWQKLFRERQKRMEGDDRSGGPSSSKTDENLLRVKNLVNNDRGMSIRMIAGDLGNP